MFTPNLKSGPGCMYEPTSYHKRPPGGSLASGTSPPWLGRMTLPAAGRPKPPLGLAGLPARPLAGHPETVPANRASGAAARSPCTLRQAGGAPRVRHPCSPMRRGRLRRPARPCAGLQQPQRPDRPPRWPPRQRSAAASQRSRCGLSTCELRQASSHSSADVHVQGWCSVRPVTVVLVRVRR